MNKQEKYAVVFSSKTGNTNLLAEHIRKNWGEENCSYFGKPEQNMAEKIKEASIIFVGFWTDKGTCDEITQEFLSQLKEKKISLFGTAGFGGSEEYFQQILNRAAALIDSSNTIIDSYMCQGKMPLSVKDRYEKMLEMNPDDSKIKMFIENFDKAIIHPNEKDIENLNQWLTNL